VAREAAWEVLTDYGGISAFVPAVKRSRVAGGKPGEATVEQELAGGWLFFSRRVTLLLEVRETPPDSLRFEEVSGKDFASYAGEWTLEARDGGTFVTYHLRAEPKFHVPAFAVKSGFKSGARDLLRGIRAEMIRRGGRRK
jgi:hypothetical protein